MISNVVLFIISFLLFFSLELISHLFNLNIKICLKLSKCFMSFGNLIASYVDAFLERQFA